MKLLVVTHAFPFPDFEIRRGGRPMYNSLELLCESGDVEIEVAFFIPKIPNFIYERIYREKLANLPERYFLNGISIRPLYYIPRLPFAVDVYAKQKLLRKLIGKLRKEGFGPEVLYSESIYPDFVISNKVALQQNVRHLAIMRGSDIHKVLKENDKIASRVKREIANAGELSLLSVSKALADLFRNIVEVDLPIGILYTLIDFERFFVADRRPEKNKFLFVGTLVASKGIFEVYQACKELIEEGFEFSLTWVGKGSEADRLKAMANNDGLHPDFSFLGWQDSSKISGILAAHDVLLFGSYNEGLPNAVVEAVASKMTIITTDVGGVKEICPPNDSFRLIPPRDTIALKEEIKQLLLSDEMKIGTSREVNYNFAFNKFSKGAHLAALRRHLSK